MKPGLDRNKGSLDKVTHGHSPMKAIKTLQEPLVLLLLLLVALNFYVLSNFFNCHKVAFVIQSGKLIVTENNVYLCLLVVKEHIKRSHSIVMLMMTLFPCTTILDTEIKAKTAT